MEITEKTTDPPQVTGKLYHILTELFLRIISLAHGPTNVTDVSIGSINCDLNNVDRGRSIIRVT